MVTLHRPDGDPSAEIYTFVDLPGTTKLPLLMAHFCFLPLQEDVQVDFDLRPDPPFPATKGSSALGQTKPFTDDPEEGLLIFNMTVMTETAESFTHLVIAVSKSAMLTMARQRFRACKAQSHALYSQGTDRESLGDNSQRKFAHLSWELWGSTSTRIFEDNTLSTNWVRSDIPSGPFGSELTVSATGLFRSRVSIRSTRKAITRTSAPAKARTVSNRGARLFSHCHSYCTTKLRTGRLHLRGWNYTDSRFEDQHT